MSEVKSIRSEEKHDAHSGLTSHIYKSLCAVSLLGIPRREAQRQESPLPRSVVSEFKVGFSLFLDVGSGLRMTMYVFL